MSRLQQLAERRAGLIQRAAQQRAEASELFRRLERSAAIFDKVCAVARGVRSHPAIALSAGLAAAFYLRKYVAVGRLTGAALTALRIGMSFARILPPRKR
jgi:hypothetical protein